MTDRDRLRQHAELLWGSRWQTAMQEDVGVSRRTLARYLGGKPVPDRIFRELETALLERLTRIAEVLGVHLEINDIKGEGA